MSATTVRARARSLTGLGLFLGPLLLRLIHLRTAAHSDWLSFPVADAQHFDRMGRAIAQGHLLGERHAFFLGPLYSYYLGAIYAVCGPHRVAAIFVQCVLSALTVVLTFKIADRLLSRRAAWLAAALLAAAGPAIYFSGLLLMETLIALLNAAALWMVVRDAGARRPLRYAAAGLLLGLAATGRPSELALLLPVAAHAWWLGRARAQPSTQSGGHPSARQSAGPSVQPAADVRARPAAEPSTRPRARQPAVAIAALVVGAACGVAPATVHNLLVEHDFVLTTFSGGFNLYAGNGPEANGTAVTVTGIKSTGDGVRAHAQHMEGRSLKSSQVSRWWARRALVAMRDDPGRVAGLFARKLWFCWSTLDLPQIEWFSHDRRDSWLLRLLPGFALLQVLAVVGMVVLWRRLGAPLLLYGFVLVYTLSIALFFVTSRYRIGLLPVTCLFAGGAVEWGWQALRARRWRAAIASLAGAAVAAWMLTPPRSLVDWSYTNSQQEVRHAFWAAQRGENSTAQLDLKRAIRLLPTNWEAVLGLGVFQRQTDSLAASVVTLQTATQLNPQSAEVHYHLAVSLFKAGRQAEARATIDRALALDSFDARTLEYAGVVRASAGERAEAEALFRQSIALDPTRASARNNLGTLLGRQERHAEALTEFRAAVACDPHYLPARRNLVLSLLALGRNGEAGAENETLRRMAAAAAPGATPASADDASNPQFTLQTLP